MALITAIAGLPLAAAWAAEMAATRDDGGVMRALPGPVPATMVRVVDGDTVEVAAHIWIGQSIQTLVRIDGIDAPELRARCDAERSLAVEARARLEALIPPGSTVVLHGVTLGKFAGRVVARVRSTEGVDVGADLVGAGLARPYDGGRRAGWCDSP